MEQLKLKKYNLFLEDIPNTESWRRLSGLAYTPRRYFYLADIQIQSFLSALDNKFNKVRNSSSKDYGEYCYSYCYGFYILIRTCLEVSQKLNNAFQENNFSQELENYRASAWGDIQSIINIANDCMKHPVENQGKVTWYEPGGLEYPSKLSIYEWSMADNNHSKVLTINPKEDIIKVYNHLEKLAEIYIKMLNEKK